MEDAKKILLVEDEKNIILGVKTCLELANYEAVVVQDGEKAIEAAVKEQPHLVLLDLMLPKVDGFEVCRQLKSRRNKAYSCGCSDSKNRGRRPGKSTCGRS